MDVERKEDELGATVNIDFSISGEEKNVAAPGREVHDGFCRREAKRMARNPCKYLLVALVVFGSCCLLVLFHNNTAYFLCIYRSMHALLFFSFLLVSIFAFYLITVKPLIHCPAN